MKTKETSIFQTPAEEKPLLILIVCMVLFTGRNVIDFLKRNVRMVKDNLNVTDILRDIA